MGWGKCLCGSVAQCSKFSIGQVEYEIQKMCMVRMRNSGLDLPGEKHFTMRDPSKLMLKGPQRLGVMGWVMGSASTTLPSPPPSLMGLSPINGVLLVSTWCRLLSVTKFIFSSGWDAGQELHVRGARCWNNKVADFLIRNYGYCINC